MEVFRPDGTLNNRGDQAKAIDNSIESIAILTPPFTTGAHIAAFDLGNPVDVNRIRVAKVGDTQSIQGGGKEMMNLETKISVRFMMDLNLE